jgi:hypothetical protein
MTLSTTSIYAPLDDFFRSRFATSPGSTAVFRFDRFGSAVSDADFVDPTQPEAGCSAVLARELISELANRVPVDDGDGVHVTLSSGSFDSFYFDRLLSPAEPFLPAGLSEADTASVIAAFSRTKSRGQRLWADLTLESSSGLRLAYRPVETTPAGWYDPTQDVWTHTSFTIDDDPQPQSPPLTWRLRPSEAALKQILTSRVPEPTRLVTARRSRASVDELAVSRTATAVEPVDVQQLTLVRWPGLLVNRSSGVGPVVVDGASARNPVVRRPLDRVDLRERLLLRRLVEEAAPSEVVASNRVEISFDYCLVRLQRPWYLDSFVTDRTWRIPNQPAGGLTRPGVPGDVSNVATGFVAIRGLRIEANWSDQDRANAQGALSFGPFDVSASSGTGEVSQPGLQLIGWILEPLPALPPNDTEPGTPGGSGEPTVRTYTVKAGDTLSKIAQSFYGDASQWTRIAEANDLPDPDRISVGQRLVIP